MVDHTPTPWRLHGLYPEEIYATVDNKRMQVAEILGACSSDQDVSNAAFIVMAANNHAALVKALKEAERFMTYFAGEEPYHFVGPGTPTSCLTQIRDALGAVGGSGK